MFLNPLHLHKIQIFSGLAGLAGISIDSYNDSKLSPNIYPMILKDISFKRELLNIKINENSTLKDYLNNQRSYYLNSILINPLVFIIDLKLSYKYYQSKRKFRY